MKIELAKSEDLDELVDILKGVIDTLNNQGINQWDDLYPNRDVYQEDINKQQLYLVRDDNQIISSFALNSQGENYSEDGHWSNDHYLIIHRFLVNSTKQHQGVGNRVLKEVIKYIKNMGYQAIRLDCFVENPYSTSLYKKNGFVKVGQTKYRKGYFDLYELIIK